MSDAKHGTAIKTCSCENKYQDRRYGKRRRVHNVKASGAARCTCCGKER